MSDYSMNKFNFPLMSSQAVISSTGDFFTPHRTLKEGEKWDRILKRIEAQLVAFAHEVDGAFEIIDSRRNLGYRITRIHMNAEMWQQFPSFIRRIGISQGVHLTGTLTSRTAAENKFPYHVELKIIESKLAPYSWGDIVYMLVVLSVLSLVAYILLNRFSAAI